MAQDGWAQPVNKLFIFLFFFEENIQREKKRRETKNEVIHFNLLNMNFHRHFHNQNIIIVIQLLMVYAIICNGNFP